MHWEKSRDVATNPARKLKSVMHWEKSRDVATNPARKLKREAESSSPSTSVN
jgi:hypothetical protein